MRLVILCFFLAIITYSSAQTLISSEAYAYYNNANKLRPVLTIYLKDGLKNDFSFVSYSLFTRTWAESMVGINKSFAPWIQAEILAGFETYGDIWRISPCLNIKKGKFYYLGLLEFGASGYWYLTYLTYGLSSKAYLGFLANKSLGYGLRFDYYPKSSPVSLWIAPIKEWKGEGYGGILGLSLNLKRPASD